MKTKKKSGQILILVLLVVVVSLAIGLSVASRNLSNLKISSQTEQSQRAYTVAENGIEKVLADLNNIKTNPTITSGGVLSISSPTDSAGTTGTVQVAVSKFPEKQVPLGEVMQVDLSQDPEGYDYTIMWGKKSSINECSKPASLEVTFIAYDIVNNPFQFRYYLQGASGTDRVETNAEGSFNYGNLGSPVKYTPATYVGSSACATPSCIYAYNSSCGGAEYCDGYVNCARMSSNAALPKPGGGSQFAHEPIMMRIRPIWNDTTINVQHGNLASYPGSTTQFVTNQEYTITSTSTVGNGATRKIQVTKSALPSVPAVFDFALYSETNISK